MPTLALGALGLATTGVPGATAVINCDLGTGIRMVAPIAMLSSLTLSAEHSLRGAASVATDTAQVVFMEDSLIKLLQFHDVSGDLRKNIRTSWGLIVVPNLICIAGAFFAGSGVMHSIVFNQIGGMLAVDNGLLPLRKASQLRAAKEQRLLPQGV